MQAEQTTTSSARSRPRKASSSPAAKGSAAKSRTPTTRVVNPRRGAVQQQPARKGAAGAQNSRGGAVKTSRKAVPKGTVATAGARKSRAQAKVAVPRQPLRARRPAAPSTSKGSAGKAGRGAPAPKAGKREKAQPAGEAAATGGDSSVLIDWELAPGQEKSSGKHGKRRVTARVVLGSDFQFASKAHSALLLERVRNLAKNPRFNMAVWKSVLDAILSYVPKRPKLRGQGTEKFLKPYDEMRNVFRTVVAHCGTARRAARRRQRAEVDAADGDDQPAAKRRPGFRGLERVSDKFAEFMAAIGAGWKVGEFHSRGRGSTCTFGYIREMGLKTPQGVRIDDKLRTLLTEEQSKAFGDYLPDDTSLPKILSCHFGEKMTFPTSCTGPVPEGNDDSPVPVRFIKSTQSRPGTLGVSFDQLACVTNHFIQCITKKVRDFPAEPAGTLHSRRVCLAIAEKYCAENGLVSVPTTNSTATDAAGRRRPVMPHYKVDGAIRSLFEVFPELKVPAEGSLLNENELKFIVFRHVNWEPQLPSDCPPLSAKDAVEIDKTQLPWLAKPAPATAVDAAQ